MTWGREWGAAVALLAVAGSPGWGLPAAPEPVGPPPPAPRAPDGPPGPAAMPARAGQVDLVPTLAKSLGMLEAPPPRGGVVRLLAAALARVAGAEGAAPGEPLAGVLAMTLWRRTVDPDRRYRLAVELAAALGRGPDGVEPTVARVREALRAIGLPGPDVGLVETEVRRLARGGA